MRDGLITTATECGSAATPPRGMQNEAAGKAKNSAEPLKSAVQIGKGTRDLIADRFQLREMLVNLRNTVFGRTLAVGETGDA